MTPPVASKEQSDSPDKTHLTPDDLRHKALAVRDMVQGEARQVMQGDTTRVVIAGVVVVAVALSLAYYLGTRAAARSRPMLPR